MIKDLLIKNRSYRRFYQNEKIESNVLKELVELTRYCASGRNAQPMKYVVVESENKCEEVFSTLSWAGYLKDWAGPSEGERPSAYVIQFNDKSIADNYFCDEGISAQSLLLGAVEKGYGGCILQAFNRERIKEITGVGDNYEPLQVIALGKPKEDVVIDDIKDGDFKYWRDGKEVHHVPKRTLDEILLKKL